MNSDTDLANEALALLGEMPISNIADVDSKPARTCRQFAAGVIDEVLRLGRWNCATRRATLSQLVPAPVSGRSYRYSLPEDYLRLLDLNGEPSDDSTEYLQIEGRELLTDDSTAVIRYVARVPIGACDPLLKHAIACRLAAKVAIPLTGSQEKVDLMFGLAERALAKARQVDCQEAGSGENTPWNRILGRSRLLRFRGRRRNPERLEDF